MNQASKFRRSVIPCAAACAFLGLMIVAATPASALPKLEGTYREGSPYLLGVLTVKNGQKTISWDVATSSDDNVFLNPATDAVASNQARASDHLESDYSFCMTDVMQAAGSPVVVDPIHGYNEPCSFTSPVTRDLVPRSPTVVDEFVSEILPSRAVVNVETAFGLSLFFQDVGTEKACDVREDAFPLDSRSLSTVHLIDPALDVELWMDGKPFAGATHESVGGGVPREAPGDGYGACDYSFQSEKLVLEKGSRITLKVRHIQQRNEYAYGLSGTHRSFLVIWLLTPEQILYQHPELLERGNDDPYVGEGGNAPTDACVPGVKATTTSNTAGLAGLLLGLPGLASKRRRTLGLVIALCAVGVSGCLEPAKPTQVRGGVEPTPSGTGTVDIYDDCEGTLTVVGKGTILGQVHDDLHLPIEAVHVSIQGQPDFAETGRDGRFGFVNLTAGTYKLRFDHPTYVMYQQDVEVKVRKVTRPDIQLVLKVPKAGDARPHDHNYWDTATTHTFTDVVITTTELAEGGNCGDPPGIPFSFAPGAANTVFPGTGDVAITFTWDASKRLVDRYALWLWAGPSFGCQGMLYVPRGTGETFHLAATNSMADIGHALKNRWTMRLVVPADDRPTWAEDKASAQPAYDWGTITVHTVITRGGPIPLGEPHPDDWADGPRVAIVTEDQRSYDYSPQLSRQFNLGSAPPCPEPAQNEEPCGHLLYPVWTPNKVAPHTGSIDVLLVMNRAPVPAYEITKLYYSSPGNTNPNADPQTLVGYTGVDPLPGSTWDAMRFKINVVKEQWDEVYGGGGWTLTFRVSDPYYAYLDDRITAIDDPPTFTLSASRNLEEA